MRLDAWLATRHVRLVRLLLILQLFGLAFFIAGTHGAFSPMPKPPTTTDFASFYAAGSLSNAGQPAAAYDEAAHARAEAAAIAPGVEEKRFLYPPVFLLVCAPFARLPYLPAFVLFEALTFLAWLLLTSRIAGAGRLGAAWLASIPAVWWALGWGQNSFLSGGLMAAGTWLLRARPFLAGLAFGALCFKPNFGVLLPVALLAGRQWRAVLGAACSVAAFGAVSVAVFGTDTWRAFLAMAAGSRQAVESGIKLTAHADWGGALRLAGVPAGASWAVQAAVSLAAALCVGWVWARVRREDEAAWAPACAVLVAGTVMAMPFVLFYDLVMLGVAAAWLARAARLDGWRPGEVVGLAATFLASLAAFPAASLLHLGVGVLAAPIVLFFGMKRPIAQVAP